MSEPAPLSRLPRSKSPDATPGSSRLGKTVLSPLPPNGPASRHGTASGPLDRIDDPWHCQRLRCPRRAHCGPKAEPGSERRESYRTACCDALTVRRPEPALVAGTVSRTARRGCRESSDRRSPVYRPSSGLQARNSGIFSAVNDKRPANFRWPFRCLSSRHNPPFSPWAVATRACSFRYRAVLPSVSRVLRSLSLRLYGSGCPLGRRQTNPATHDERR